MVILLRWLKRLGFLVLALIALYAVGRPTQIWLDGFYSGVREPYLQMVSSNAMTLRWQSEKPFKGWVRYGVKPDQLNQQKNEIAADEEHEIRLTDLKSATKYFYSVGSESEEKFKGQDFWFKTAPANNVQPVRFWVTGDQGQSGLIQDQVRDSALAWVKHNPRSPEKLPLYDFWITTGDNAYRSGTNEQFQTAFFSPYKNILRNTPVWPAYGNHDARRWVFFDIFSFPEKAESGGVASGTENYYSFDYANIHFVMLDTQDSSFDKEGEMLSWLKEDLKQNKKQWLIAAFHHPPYTKGSHDSDNKWRSGGRLNKTRESIIPVLEQAGVDLVLAGHSHMYERSALINCHYGLSNSFSSEFIRDSSKDFIYKKKENKLAAYNGTVYAVVGSSSKLNDGPLNHPALPYSFKQAGSLVVDVKGNKLSAAFINKKGVVIDKFEIIKGVSDGVDTEYCK